MTPIANNIENAIIPSRELGKPKTSPCQEVAAETQLTKGFKLQGRSVFGSLISLIVSKVNKNEARRPIMLPTISM
jgi:hypothetical protein